MLIRLRSLDFLFYCFYTFMVLGTPLRIPIGVWFPFQSNFGNVLSPNLWNYSFRKYNKILLLCLELAIKFFTFAVYTRVKIFQTFNSKNSSDLDRILTKTIKYTSKGPLYMCLLLFSNVLRKYFELMYFSSTTRKINALLDNVPYLYCIFPSFRQLNFKLPTDKIIHFWNNLLLLMKMATVVQTLYRIGYYGS